MIRKTISLLFILFLFDNPLVLGQALNGTVYGTVRDSSSNQPIVGATVSSDDGTSTVTDDNGLYILELSPGTKTISAQAENYLTESQETTVSEGVSVPIDFNLEPFRIDIAYPSLFKRGSPTGDMVKIRGSGFDTNTRLSMNLDTGNSGKVINNLDINARTLVVVEDIAYFACRNDGLQFYDISNPAQPVFINSFAMSDAVYVEVAGDFAYVKDGSISLKIIDVSDLANPTYKGEYTVTNPKRIGDFKVKDNYAYMIVSEVDFDFVNGELQRIDSELQIIDVSVPETPTFNNSFSVDGEKIGASRLNIVEDKLYMSILDATHIYDLAIYTSRLQIVDISDPTSPTILGSTDWIPNCDLGTITVVNGIAYVSDAWGELLTFNVSDPENPFLLSRIETTDGFESIEIIGNLAYLAAGVGGIKVIDISDPANPFNVGVFDIQGEVGDMYVKDQIAIITVGYRPHPGTGVFSYTTQFVDISNPAPTTLLGSALTFSLDVTLGDNDIAYVAGGNRGLHIVDISQPSNPEVLSTIDTGYISKVRVFGNKAYILSLLPSVFFQVVDVTDPTAPVFLGELDMETNITSVRFDCIDKYCYVAIYNEVSKKKEIRIIDVTTDPANPSFIKSIPIEARDIVVVGTTVYVSIQDGFVILNASDPLNPDTLHQIPLTSGGSYCLNQIAIDGSKAFIASQDNGLSIIDVDLTDPSNPKVLGTVDTPYYACDVAVQNNWAYVADMESGIQMVDVSDPTNPVIVGAVDTPGTAWAVQVRDRICYVADQAYGFTIVPAPEEITVNNIDSEEDIITATIPSPPVAGNYNIRVFNDSQYWELPGAVTFTDEINLLSSKAIIVAGGSPSGNNLIWEETKAYANNAYDNLIFQGFRHEDITYLTDEPTPLLRYGWVGSFANVDTATWINLGQAITDWAIQPNASGQPTSDLLVYLVDHGETENFLMGADSTPSYLSSVTLDSWLDTLQDDLELPGKVMVVYDACKAGSFIPWLVPPEGKTRITLASSSADQVAYFINKDHSFSSHFWSTFSGKSGNKAIMTEALGRAATTMSSYQVAQLDANGNGVPNEPEDYTALEGHEGTIYALRRQFYYKDRSKPVISIASDDQQLNGANSATLMARGVYDADGDSITKVWAEIVAPDFDPDPTGLTVKSSSLPPFELPGPGANDVYEDTYTGFTVKGTYIVNYYAEDSSGIYSLPKTSLVTQTIGTTSIPPDQYENDNTIDDAQIIIPNSPTPQNHTFHVNGDEDWVKFYGIKNQVYNIRAMNPTLISDPAITIKNGSFLVLASSNSSGSGEEEAIFGWTCPADGKYYVRITNKSGYYGANVRYKLKVYNPVALNLPGYITGRITSGGVGVAGAIVSAGGGSAITLSDGSYIMYLMPGSYTVSVSSGGYESASFGASVGSGGHTSLPTVNLNGIPRIINTPAGVAKTNQTYTYTPVVVEPDGDPYTLSITGKPGWASFTTSNGRLSGTPRYGDEGTYGPIIIRATDSKGATGSMVFKINVMEGIPRSMPAINFLLLKP